MKYSDYWLSARFDEDFASFSKIWEFGGFLSVDKNVIVLDSLMRSSGTLGQIDLSFPHLFLIGLFHRILLDQYMYTHHEDQYQNFVKEIAPIKLQGILASAGHNHPAGYVFDPQVCASAGVDSMMLCDSLYEGVPFVLKELKSTVVKYTGDSHTLKLSFSDMGLGRLQNSEVENRLQKCFSQIL